MIPARLIKSGDIVWVDDEYCKIKTVFDHHSYRDPRITFLVETSQGKEKRATFSPNDIVAVHISPSKETTNRLMTSKEIQDVVSRFEAKNRGVTWSVYQGDKALLHNLQEWSAKAIVGILNGESSWEYLAMQEILVESAIERGIFEGLKTQFEDISDIRIDKRVTGDVSVRDLRTERHWIVKIDEVTEGG